MFENIRNIYCVGRNYKAHAEEMGNDLPLEPMIFTKPTHALIVMDDGLIELPGSKGSVHYEAELVVHIGRNWELGLQADELVDKMAFGIDFTLRDVQASVIAQGMPWLPSKGFIHSGAVGPWLDFPGIEALNKQDFTLTKNGEEVQRGNTSMMIFGLQQIIDYCAANYGLGKGDIIFTGTPEGIGPVQHKDRLMLHWGDDSVGACVIGLE